METDHTCINKSFESESISSDNTSSDGSSNVVEENHNDSTTNEETKKEKSLGLLYKVGDKPDWYLCIFLGIQHCILAIGGLIGVPLFLAPVMCMSDNDVGYLGTAMVLNSLFFISGIITFLQTTFGTRLPILQGGTFTFLPSALAILALPQNQCPAGPVNLNETNGTILYNDTDGTLVDGTELWQRRMRQIQGAIAVASVAEVILAVTGCIGFLMRFIGPLTIAPSVALIGLTLFDAASYNASGQWGIAFFTMAVLIISSQYLRDVKLPFPFYTKKRSCHIMKTNFIKLFPGFITIVLAWLLCLILTKTEALPDDPSQPGYRGRTDVRISVLDSSPW